MSDCSIPPPAAPSPPPSAVPDAPPPADASAGAPPTPAQLFLGFAKIAVCGFGGVMAWARRVMVVERGWLSPQAFNEVMSLCQVLPGPNVVNVSVVFGARSAGLAGALAALSGLIGPPMLLMIAAGALYARFGNLPELRGMLAGAAAAAAGMIVATSVQMSEPLWRSRLSVEHGIAIATFVAAGLLRAPLLPVMAVMIPISIALAWWRHARR